MAAFSSSFSRPRRPWNRPALKRIIVRWWDAAQRGDIIHFAGPAGRRLHCLCPRPGLQGRRRGTADRDRLAFAQRTGAAKNVHHRVLRKILPAAFTARMAWDAYRLADACIANTAWEAHLMHYLFAAPRERVHVVPNGVEEIFLNSAPAARGPWLVCTATITERKRVLELAKAAVAAQTPLWIIGQSLFRFRRLRAKIFRAGETAAANPPLRRRRLPTARGWRGFTARRAALSC